MEKDIQMFINLAKYLNKGNRYLFVLVGDGNLCNTDFFNSINETSNILYLGFRRDIDVLIQMSTICVLFSNPPHEEGISNFIIEAMAQGKPVIATVGGGTNEIIVSEHNGFLVNPFDYISVAAIIKELLNDTTTYNRISRYSFDTIYNKFNFRSMLEKYNDLYKSFIYKKMHIIK
jgi:glycosyltransferase involved in cell wall biosynthesis